MLNKIYKIKDEVKESIVTLHILRVKDILSENINRSFFFAQFSRYRE